MGLLAPLYALAALSVIGPIVFHLIRRQPQGNMAFSSLMFLSPSPPRLTRRSRLDNLLLLLLRVLAIALIAFAFARPYLRQESLLNTVLTGRTIVLLVDTSGSMKREDVWASAQQKAGQLLDSLTPEDRIALYTIDEKLRTIQSLEDLARSDGAATQDTVRGLLPNIVPTWNSSQLATGLRTVADALNAASIAGQIDAEANGEVVLITDLHRDSGLEGLQGYSWPSNVTLDVRQVLPDKPGNARPSLMAIEDSGEEERKEEGHRIRIENSSDSEAGVFSLEWTNESGRTLTSTSVQVPPGQVRVVSVGLPPVGADRVRLKGDAWDGDNDVFAVEVEPVVENVLFVGQTEIPDEDRLDYFLSKAPLATATAMRTVVTTSVSDLQVMLGEDSTSAVILEPMEELNASVGSLQEFAKLGGTVLVSLARSRDDYQLESRFLKSLLELPELNISEAQVKDFSLVSGIDYRHPVFVPFADPRFNDFSKIRFWSHRTMELSKEQLEENGLHAVASFDDESVMLLQKQVGKGSIWVFPSGWQPKASSLALSTKFVPILMGIIDPGGNSGRSEVTREVGESIMIEDASDVRVEGADGAEVGEELVTVAGNELKIFEPGVYSVYSGKERREIAVQIPLSESRLAPMDSDVFEQFGVGTGKTASADSRRESARQLKIEELESKQRLWQWLIAAGIVVLAAETLIAGVFARRNSGQMTTA